MSTIIYHNHHIVPKYRCKEIGIDPDFPENIVRLTRSEHGQAHYERWLKHKDPRDLSAAQLLALGEIDGIDLSGENHPSWGKKRTPETRKKMSVSAKKRTTPNGMQGKTHSEEIRKKMSIFQTNRFRSPETRKKMSEVQKGRKHLPEIRKKLSNSSFNGKGLMTEETKKKMSESAKMRWANGRSWTEETKKKMSESAKRSWAKRRLAK